MSFATAFSILGWLLAVLGVAMAAPAATGLVYGETAAATAFALSAALTVFVGGALIIAARAPDVREVRREAFAAAVLVWVVGPAFAAIPLAVLGATESVLSAYLEAVSGLTTTGGTVLADLDSAARSVLLWRGLLQWLGGIGTVVLVIVHLSHLGIGGMQLYSSALVHGEQDPLTTRLRHAATSLIGVYAALTLACMVALWLTGLTIFDAVTLALSTLSTGGFSPRDGGVGAYASRAVEAVLVVFMILGAANFSGHWLALRGRGLGHYWRDPELTMFLVAAAVAAALMAAALAALGNTRILESAWFGVFHAVSALSTTGFVTGEGLTWPTFVPVLLVALMLIGGSTGSTAGGLKIMRVVLLARLARREMERLTHPHGVVPFNYGGKVVDDGTRRGIWAVFFALVFTFAALTLALGVVGMDFSAAAFAAAAAVTNTAPMTATMMEGSANYASAGESTKALLAAGMILGRLEFLSVLVLLNPLFWRR